MKFRFTKKILAVITVLTILTDSFSVISIPAAAFHALPPDTGVVNGISSGGEWSIYGSRFGQITTGSSTVNDVTDSKGVVEVTGVTNYRAAMQFDLSTKTENEAAVNKVIKSAALRLTPMVSKANAKQMLYSTSNGFQTVDKKNLITEFDVPRGEKDDFWSDTDVLALSSDITSYPEALSNWQTSIDVTGEVIAADDKLSLLLESSSKETAKTEYATSNIELNNRLNTGKVSMLYDNGATDYSKWIYPQIVFEYTDEEYYQNAYYDFVKANSELCSGGVNETDGISVSASEHGSVITLQMYGDTDQPVKIDGNRVVFNDDYVGNEDCGNVKLIVTNIGSGGEIAAYTRVVSVPAEYTRSNTISFDTAKNAKGELSITSSGKTYTDGIAYAKPGGVFTVNDGANIGYRANVVVTTEDGDERVTRNDDGTYTMPESNVSVSVSHEKRTYGTTRIAAVNSASVKSDGSVAGKDNNITIAAGRLAFIKFDLSGYDKKLITSAKLSVAADQTNNKVSTAIFYVPNNNWTETSGLGKEFCMVKDDSNTRLNAIQGSTNLFDNTNTYNQVVPGLDESMLEKSNGEADLSSAENGILKDYFLDSYDAELTLDVTSAIQEALERNAADNNGDGMITLMIYSPRKTGFDIRSIATAPELGKRPSLTIMESSANLQDEELITEIHTVQDLEMFSDIVDGGNSYAGKTVTLHDDIDLSEQYNKNRKSWVPIGIYDSFSGMNPFAGTFEGGSHTIRGLYINEQSVAMGLFGAVTGSVQNLTVEGAIKGSSVIGGIAGLCSGSIVNCHSRVAITAKREAGGIVGTLSNGGSISQCTNSGSIEIQDKETYAGGIAAHNICGVISHCLNKGVVQNGSNGFRNRLGGIVGFLDYGEIKNSDNNGDVRSETTYSTYVADESQNYVGGVTGYSQHGIVTECHNTGAVYNAVDYVGGIAGYLHSNDTVSKCYNGGSVSGKGYAGGIAGNNNSTVSDCYNTNTVAGTGRYTGGTVGYFANGSIENCYNTGSVSGGESAGGVVGYCLSGSASKCYYLDETAAGGINGLDMSGAAESKTAHEFASGEVAYLLQNQRVELIWGQTVNGASLDAYPIVTKEKAKKVYKVTFMNNTEQHAVRYGNTIGVDSMPDDPVSDDNVFNGWKTDDNTKFTQTTMLARDITVSADFTQNQLYIEGDVNQDGNITAIDALLTLKISNSDISDINVTDVQTTVADYDNDGNVTVNDVLAILKRASQKK